MLINLLGRVGAGVGWATRGRGPIPDWGSPGLTNPCPSVKTSMNTPNSLHRAQAAVHRERRESAGKTRPSARAWPTSWLPPRAMLMPPSLTPTSTGIKTGTRTAAMHAASLHEAAAVAATRRPVARGGVPAAGRPRPRPACKRGYRSCRSASSSAGVCVAWWCCPKVGAATRGALPPIAP